MGGALLVDGRGEPGQREAVRVVRVEAAEDVAGPPGAGRALHFNPSHLVRAFSREFGMSPHQYLTSRRVDEARRLILSGEPLSSVARSSGFYDQPHLARHFKRILGVSPGAFASTSYKTVRPSPADRRLHAIRHQDRRPAP